MARRRAAIRAVQKVSSTRAFAKAAPYALPALDRTLHRLTGGGTMLSDHILPSALLTSKGAVTGLPRRTPLACMPEEGGTWVLIGSNFGRPRHPVWTGNLLAHPDAVISVRGRDTAVTARLLEGEEREEAWREVLEFWPPYAAYAARASGAGRRIRLFRLTPDGGT